MDQVVDSFDKNAVDQIRATISEYRGRQLFSLRVWTEIKGGERVPSKRGLTLTVEQFPRFYEAVEKLKEALIGAGSLDAEDLED